MSSTHHRSTKGEARQARSTQRGTVAARFRELNTFVDLTMALLSPAERAVWLCLFRDSREGIARSAQSDIGRRSGLSARHVRRTLAALIAKQLVAIVHQGRHRGDLSSYHVRALPPGFASE